MIFMPGDLVNANGDGVWVWENTKTSHLGTIAVLTAKDTALVVGVHDNSYAIVQLASGQVGYVSILKLVRL